MTEYIPDIELEKIAGSALLVGFLLVVAVLYGRTPSSALGSATTSVGAAVYLLVLPALGLGAGVYAYIDAPYAEVPAFVFGSYLGVVGIGLAFGTLVAATTSMLLLLGGTTLVTLSVTALVASLLRLVGAVGVGLPGGPAE